MARTPVSRRNDRWLLFALLGLFVLCVWQVGLARAPWWDEAAFADPASNFALHGKLVTTTWSFLIPGKPVFPGMDRFMYWTMPGYVVTLGLWFKAFGFSIVSMHAYSLLWGALLILSWYIFVKKLTGSSAASLLTGSLIAVNTSVVYSASTGRPDCMVSALGALSLASYMAIRDRHFSRAILVSCTFAALAFYTHPLGLIHVVALVLCVLLCDWRRIGLGVMVLSCIPFVILGACWGLYILQSPALFNAQFFGHVSSRLSGVAAPWTGFPAEIKVRYFDYFVNGSKGWLRLRWIIPLTYLGAFIYLFYSPAVRRLPAARLLMVLSISMFLTLSVLDGERFSHYLVHVFPIYSAVLSCVALWAIRAHTFAGRILVTGTALTLIFQTGILMYKIQDRAGRRDYERTLAVIQATADKQTLIMGCAEFMFGLGRDYRLIDDSRLGFYSGLRPKMLIRGRFQPDPSFFQSLEPDAANYMRTILPKTRRINQDSVYGVYLTQ